MTFAIDDPHLPGFEVPLDANGVAAWATTQVAGGDHKVYATYMGAETFVTDYTFVRLVGGVVANYEVSLVVVADPSPSAVGEEVIFTAMVFGDGPPESAIPTGSVLFTVDGPGAPGTEVSIDATGVAVWRTTDLTVGQHTVYATYAGSGEFAEASGQTVHTVE